MRNILQEHNNDLRQVTTFCLKGFAAELYTSNLISLQVKNEPTFNSIINEFEAGINIENDASKLTRKWELFCQSLRKQKGPAMMLGDIFEKKMNSEKNETNLSKLKFLNFLQNFCSQRSLAETSTEHLSDDSFSQFFHCIRGPAGKEKFPNNIISCSLTDAVATATKRLPDESRIVETRNNKDEKAGMEETQIKEENKMETSVNPSTKINEETDSSDAKNEDKEEAGMPRVSEIPTVQGIVFLSLVIILLYSM